MERTLARLPRTALELGRSRRDFILRDKSRAPSPPHIFPTRKARSRIPGAGINSAHSSDAFPQNRDPLRVRNLVQGRRRSLFSKLEAANSVFG